MCAGGLCTFTVIVNSIVVLVSPQRRPLSSAIAGGIRPTSLNSLSNMSSPPSDDKAARRRELYMTIAEHVKVVSSLVTSLADGPINVPVLKGVADLVNKITDIAVVGPHALS